MATKRKKRLNVLKRGRRSKMLFVFLGLSFLFWMLIKLSKVYTDVVHFKVDYINLPQGKMLQEEPNKTIDVVLKTHGFNLMKYHINRKTVNVDLNKIRRKKGLIYYQLADDLLPQIQQQVTSDIEVIAVQPDSLYYHIGISKTKNVPIISDVNIQFDTGYNMLDDFKIEPELVSISGPEILIDSIVEVKTEAIVLTDINSSIELELPIVKLPKTSRVSYSVDKVKITGIVEKFTEARLKLPFEIINLPKNYSISTFPDEVEVIFKIGLSDYNKINQKEFKIICDYNRTIKDGLTYLIPEMNAKPSLVVSEVKIVPNQIEYLIKQ